MVVGGPVGAAGHYLNSGSDLWTSLIELLKTAQIPKFEAREKR